LEVLKSGRIVRLPNGAQFKPTGKKDGSISIDARVKFAQSQKMLNSNVNSTSFVVKYR
jgi:hypothetical protein